MKHKVFILFISVLLFNCNNTEDEERGFVENKAYQLINLIEDAENGDDAILIIEETTEVANSDTEESDTFIRILTIKNQENLQALYFYLDLDSEGNTTEITSMRYELFEEDILDTYLYDLEIEDENDNPQSLTYSILESTESKFSITMSGVLSKFNTADNTYDTVEFSDVDLNIMF